MVGYTETSTIYDDVCVLSITGTAVAVRGLPDLTQEMRMRKQLEEEREEGELELEKSGSEKANSDVDVQHEYEQVKAENNSDGSENDKAHTKVAEANASTDIITDENNDVGDANPNPNPNPNPTLCEEVKPFSLNSRMARRRKHGERLERKRMGGGRERRTSQNQYQNQNNNSNGNSNNIRERAIFYARLAKPCSYSHVPYHHRLAPFTNMKLVPCLMCGKKWVPETILATVEPPSKLPVRGCGVLVEARVCRSRPKAPAESDALAVSDALPFLEYELMRQLMLKLKVLGRNAAFCLKVWRAKRIMNASNAIHEL